MTPAIPADVPTLRDALRQFWRLLRLVRSYWTGLGKALLLGVVVGTVGLLAPYLSKLFIDNVYPTGDVGLMHVLVAGVLTVSVVSAGLAAVSGFYFSMMGARLEAATSLLFLNHLQYLPVRFFDEHRVGEVMSRFADVRAAIGALSNTAQTLLGSGVYLLLVPPFLLVLNWRLAIVAVLTVPLTAVVSAAGSRVVRRYWKQSAEASAELGALQIEVLSHIRTVKALAAERHIYGTAAATTREVLRTQLSAGGLAVLIGALNGCVYAAGMALFTWYAWTLILRHEMSLGDFVAFSAYIGYLIGPAAHVAGLFSNFQHTAVTLGRMFEYLDEPVEQDPGGAYAPPAPAPRARGELRLDGVTLGYGSGPLVLDGVSLTLRPGTVTAVVGPSGAGKSSLLRLLCRMSEPDGGRATLDGVPLSALPLADVRRQMTVVWQDVALFRGTIEDNLTFGLDADTPGLAARVDAAVRVCRLEAMIRSLPAGLHTPVAEWGGTLSGGQRQRIAVARALVRDTPILLLDEATSQVDVETEDALLQTLFASQREKTVVFVTHRVGTAALADQICVLDEGRVVGLGAPGELGTTCDTYRRLLRAAGVALPPASTPAEVRPLRVVSEAGG